MSVNIDRGKRLKYERVLNLLEPYVDSLNADKDSYNIKELIMSNNIDRELSSKLLDVLLEVVLDDFSNLFEIKKCENCGKYFIPQMTGFTKYCNRPSPQKSNKTCKEYASKRPKGAQKEFRRVYMTLYARCKRYDENHGGHNAISRLEHWKFDHDIVKESYIKGEITEEDYIHWLNTDKYKFNDLLER